MRITFNKLPATLAGFWLLGSIYGCSHLEVKEIPITANPSDEISKLEAESTEALAQQVDVLSPDYYLQGTKALSAAKKSRDKGNETKVILRHVAEGRASLDKAKEVAQVAKTTMPKVVQARADALAANAPKVEEKEFRNADESLIDVTKDIESNDLTSAEKNREKLASLYSRIELSSIKLDKLGGATATIAKAEKEGAKANASRTLTLANKTVSDAEQYITENRHDKAGIQTRADAATAAADRLLDISRQVKVTDKRDSESVVLEREARKNQLNNATAATQATAGQLATATAAAAKLKLENSALNDEKLAAARLDSAKAQFTSEEANVYRDGNRLIIRLKTLAFPSGKANLTPESFPVLGKVQNVIAELGPSQNVVQGHTDSVGGKENNQKLSEDRANAISSYLSANGVPAASISTIGYGDTKPLAANNTKEGRAQNRRVDIIIEPSATVR